MVDKYNFYEQDDQIFSEIERDKELTTEYDLLNVKWPNPNNGEKPKSRLDQGRNCPFCGGRLFHKGELVDGDPQHILLRCAKCRREVFASDVDNPTELIDSLYRQIPLSMRLSWDENRRKYRKRGE